MSLEDAIDRGVRCVICGKARPDCRCWITLRCACGATALTERWASDADADEVESECPACADESTR